MWAASLFVPLLSCADTVTLAVLSANLIESDTPLGALVVNVSALAAGNGLPWATYPLTDGAGNVTGSVVLQGIARLGLPPPVSPPPRCNAPLVTALPGRFYARVIVVAAALPVRGAGCRLVFVPRRLIARCQALSAADAVYVSATDAGGAALPTDADASVETARLPAPAPRWNAVFFVPIAACAAPWTFTVYRHNLGG